MLIFISYRSGDRALVETLANDLDDLGHTIWFDQELTGGHAWWNSILNNVRDCDVFIFALSPQSLDSYPCQLEYGYADALGKRILPVLLKEINNDFLPPALSKIQFVDYRVQDKKASIGLARALGALPPAAPLPDPLPAPPEAPVSGLGRLKERVESNARLSLDEQAALVLELKGFYQKADTQATARDLLERFRNRSDLFASIEREIQSILSTANPISFQVNYSPAVQKTVRVSPPLANVSASPVGTQGRIRSALRQFVWAYAAALIVINPLTTVIDPSSKYGGNLISALFIGVGLVLAKLLPEWLSNRVRHRGLVVILAYVISTLFIQIQAFYFGSYFDLSTLTVWAFIPSLFTGLGFVVGSIWLRDRLRLRFLVGAAGVLGSYASLFVLSQFQWKFPIIADGSSSDIRDMTLFVAREYAVYTWIWYIAIALACSVLLYWPELWQRQDVSAYDEG